MYSLQNLKNGITFHFSAKDEVKFNDCFYICLELTDIQMPATSERQRMSAGIALRAKKGLFPVRRLKGVSLSMFNSMTAHQLKEFSSKTVTIIRKKRPISALKLANKCLKRRR